MRVLRERRSIHRMFDRLLERTPHGGDIESSVFGVSEPMKAAITPAHCWEGLDGQGLGRNREVP